MTDAKIALLVEDDPYQRQMYSLMLRRRGWTTIEARTGKEAQTLLDTIRPDVIVLDVMLPDRDGINLCRQWRATPDLPAIPILILTALSDPDTRRRALAAGANAFVSKPISPAELNDQLQQLITKPDARLTSGTLSL